MTDDILKLNDYRDVSQVGVDRDKRDRLFEAQTEACVMWSTSDGWPVGVLHRYVWAHDRFWITCASQRKRVSALTRRPQSAISVSSEGTYLGGDINGDADAQQEFVRRLDTPGRTIIELVPTSWITYDGNRLEAAIVGRPYDPALRKVSRNVLVEPAEED